jgi:WD40 repeat protein
VAEMGGDMRMIPCQLVPFSGGPPRFVGPQSGSCKYAAWSPDGKWMYFNSDAAPRVITSGVRPFPTEHPSN